MWRRGLAKSRTLASVVFTSGQVYSRVGQIRVASEIPGCDNRGAGIREPIAAYRLASGPTSSIVHGELARGNRHGDLVRNLSSGSAGLAVRRCSCQIRDTPTPRHSRNAREEYAGTMRRLEGSRSETLVAIRELAPTPVRKLSRCARGARGARNDNKPHTENLTPRGVASH